MTHAERGETTLEAASEEARRGRLAVLTPNQGVLRALRAWPYAVAAAAQNKEEATKAGKPTTVREDGHPLFLWSSPGLDVSRHYEFSGLIPSAVQSNGFIHLGGRYPPRGASFGLWSGPASHTGNFVRLSALTAPWLTPGDVGLRR